MLAERIGACQLAEMTVQGSCIECQLRADELPRLAPLVAAGPPGSLDAKIAFDLGAETLPVLHIEVHGRLSLMCQRCLGPIEWPVDVDVSLTAVADDSAAGNLSSPFDSIVLDAEGALALRAVVEDEILAALPLAPLHVGTKPCARPAGEPDTDESTVPQRVNRPFAGLADLLHRDGRDDGKE